MQAKIEIDLDVSNRNILDDITDHLETVLPYMADNVIITSVVKNALLTSGQRAALFASFGEVFASSSDEARYAFTRQVLGKRSDEPVSWSLTKPGTITFDEASRLLDTLNTLNV